MSEYELVYFDTFGKYGIRKGERYFDEYNTSRELPEENFSWIAFEEDFMMDLQSAQEKLIEYRAEETRRKLLPGKVKDLQILRWMNEFKTS